MNDLKFAVRQLLKNGGFSTVAVLTLACGIGANTAIFSLLNAVWMRSLPVRDPHELRVVNWSGTMLKCPTSAGVWGAERAAGR